MTMIKHVVTFFLALGVSSMAQGETSGQTVRRYVATYSAGQPTSFDPVELDRLENFEMARMLFATPVEIDTADKLVSSLLTSFSYDTASRTVRWVLKDGMKYADGTAIAPEDLAFAVARVLYTTPTMPVLEHIAGKGDWLSQKHPLKSFPTGITVVGQEIRITFSQPVRHPMVRFSLTLFSIVPRRCFDLEANKLVCDVPPSSGYYTLKGRDDVGWTFELRPEHTLIYGDRVPSVLRIDYVPAHEVKESIPRLSQGDVAIIFEPKLTPAALAAIRKRYETLPLPGSMFGFLLLNPTNEALGNVKCRQLLSRQFRSEFQRKFGTEFQAEASLFGKLLPGYLPASKLTAGIDITADEEAACRRQLAKHPPKIGRIKGFRDELFEDTIAATYQALGLASPVVVESADRKEMLELFASGKADIISRMSSLWELDPAGDAKMLLTSDIHRDMTFVRQDETLRSLIDAVQVEEDPKRTDALFAQANRRLAEQALIAPYVHFRIVHAASQGADLKSKRISMTFFIPWQFFAERP